jgi:AcrR family transcriptional regulator
MYRADMSEGSTTQRAVGERRSDATRVAILEATLATIAAEGDDGVRVARIAKDAGVTTGALYAHFVDRDDLISSAHMEFMRREVAKLLASTRPVRESSIEGTLQPRVLKDFLRTLLEPQPMLERRQWAEAALNAHRRPGLVGEMREVIQEFVGASSASIRLAQERGHVRSDFDPEAVALVQLAATVGLAIFAELYDPSPEGLDATAWVWAQIPSAYRVSDADRFEGPES